MILLGNQVFSDLQRRDCAEVEKYGLNFNFLRLSFLRDFDTATAAADSALQKAPSQT